jgi:hypothetical protein
MPPIEAQRTLVKSPPELWAELSNPSSLARHLGEELGEIRITRVEAETSVEWEAESATGTVALEPSGWGTKVTLTVARELPEPAVEIPEPEPEPEPEPTLPAALEPTPRRRHRLFARVFRWRTHQPAPEPDSKPEAQEAESPDLAAELAAELARLEVAMAEQDAALLAGVLDRLGAAHHRPFSRG